MQKYKTVDEYLQDLDSNLRPQVEVLRQVIVGANADLEEHIKWNAPSYIYEGEDRITFNTLNKEGVVKLVLHMGATRKEDKKGKPIINDTTGLIVWSSDIRGMLSFSDLEDIQAKTGDIKQIITQWLAINAN